MFSFLCPCCIFKTKQSSAPVARGFSSTEQLQLDKEDFHTFEHSCRVPIEQKQGVHLFLSWLE